MQFQANPLYKKIPNRRALEKQIVIHETALANIKKVFSKEVQPNIEQTILKPVGADWNDVKRVIKKK